MVGPNSSAARSRALDRATRASRPGVSNVLPSILTLVFLAGCAAAPQEMSFDPGARGTRVNRVWPAAPQTARFAYAGELTGEANFRRSPGNEPSTAMKVWSWIVGLQARPHRPVSLQRPQGGAADAEGRVYVTDVGRRAVFIFDSVAGKLLVGDMATATERFVAPIGVALGREGEILVSDAELGIVARLDPTGKPVGEIGRGVLVRPTGIARDPARGLIYVADTRDNNVKVFDDEGALVDLIGHEGDSPGALNSPTYLAVSHNRILVVDTLNSRVQIFDAYGDFERSFGKRGLYVGNMARPKGVSVGPEGNIYVIESYHDHLLTFDGSGRFLLPIGGTGHLPGQFYLPAGVWTDAVGRVYVADMFNGRVSIFQPLNVEAEESRSPGPEPG